MVTALTDVPHAESEYSAPNEVEIFTVVLELTLAGLPLELWACTVMTDEQVPAVRVCAAEMIASLEGVGGGVEIVSV
jgi:hypothetical protein